MTADRPRRYQRSRRRGSALPPDVICVTRPGPWGNPFDTADEFCRVLAAILTTHGESQFHEVELGSFLAVYQMAQRIDQLRGRSLACWCPLDKPCHADVLLEFANRDKATSDGKAGDA